MRYRHDPPRRRNGLSPGLWARAREDFALEKHRLIFAAMRRIGDEVSPGAEAVAQVLIESNKLAAVDGLAGLLDLHARAIPGIGLEGFARKLLEKSRARRALAIANTMTKSVEVFGVNGNAREIAAMAQELIGLAEGVQSAGITSVADLPGVCTTQDPIRFIREPELPEGAVVALTGDSGKREKHARNGMCSRCNRGRPPVPHSGLRKPAQRRG